MSRYAFNFYLMFHLNVIWTKSECDVCFVSECNAAIHKKCIDKVIAKCTGSAVNSKETMVNLTSAVTLTLAATLLTPIMPIIPLMLKETHVGAFL